MYKKPLFLLLLAIIIFSPLNFQTGENFLRADISHEGWKQIISTNTTWTKENGPYIIDGPLLVDEMVKLTIEAGTVIKLDKSYILILGELEATGKEDEKIVFTSIYDDKEVMDNNPSDNRAPEKGDWGSIFVYYRTGRANFDNVVFKYGGTMYDPISGVESEIGAVFAARDSYVRITNSEISNNTLGIYAYRPDFEMHNSIIVDNDTAMIGESMDYGEDGEIIDLPIVAINNYWGHASGPHHETINPDGIGNPIIDNVKFTPWLTEPPHIIGTEEEKRNPVIIVPGIMGSVLENAGKFNKEIWPNPAEYILDSGDSLLDDLKMDDYGNSINHIEPTDIIRKVAKVDFYGGLVEYLEEHGYEEGKDLFVFPYDWRLDIGNVSGANGEIAGVKTLKNKIDDILEITDSGKVDIIAHSMGGLVVKSYVKKYGQDDIGKFIDIVTPHLGAPKALKILNYGDDIGFKAYGLGIDDSRIENISQNMSSIYQLLPSRLYFNLIGKEYGSYIYNDGKLSDVDKGDLNYLQSVNYINKGGDENRYYFTNSNSLLHTTIDDVEMQDAYNIIGCGIPTIGKIEDLGKKKFFWDKYGLRYIDGDGTVPLRSADYFNDKRFYLRDGRHSPILGADVAREFILAVLAGDESSFDYSKYSNFSQSDNVCGISGKVVEYHCPVKMHIYDQDGNHVGPIESGDIEMGIPGVQYDIVDGNKFAFLPDGNQYTVTGEAEEVGALEIKISDVQNNQYGEAIYFNNIDLKSSATKIEFELNDNIEGQYIGIDEDSDGVFEKIASHDSVLNSDDLLDLVRPATEIIIESTLGKNDYHISDAQISFIASDEGSGVLKTEYSLDDGQTWMDYQVPIDIVEDGEYKIIYASIDRAGNREIEQDVIVKIDMTDPELLISETISHNQILNIGDLVSDNFSGVDMVTVQIFIDDNQISTSTVDLFYQEVGQHRLSVSVEDNAGNINVIETNFEIVNDIDGVISDVDRSRKENLINQNAYDELNRDLRDIKYYLEKFGDREEIRDMREEDIIKKCETYKNPEYCMEKMNKIFTRIEYHLNWVHSKIIKLRYSLALKSLEKFYRRGWVTENGYDIIKSDLKYLISKL